MVGDPKIFILSQGVLHVAIPYVNRCALFTVVPLSSRHCFLLRIGIS